MTATKCHQLSAPINNFLLRVCVKSGHISCVMLRSAATKHLGMGIPHHSRFFAPLRMISHTPFKSFQAPLPGTVGNGF